MGPTSKRKGENAATNENLKTLLVQTRAITDASKTIEAAISDSIWDRQKHWELKRDALLLAIEALGRADDALQQMVLWILHARTEGAAVSDSTREKRESSLDLWQERMGYYDEKRRVVSLVCSKNTGRILHIAGNEIRTSASKIFTSQASSFDEIMPAIQKAVVDVYVAARRELDIESNDEPDETIWPSSARAGDVDL